MHEERRLAESPAERLRAFIDQQRLQPGERLPAERQLAQQLMVSRSSLREALQKLISEGVLVSRRGGGNFIAERAADWSAARLVMPLSTLLADDPGYRYDVLEARIAIEASTARHAARRATAEDKAHIERCYQMMLQVSDRDDPDGGAFRRALPSGDRRSRPQSGAVTGDARPVRSVAVVGDAEPPADVYRAGDFSAAGGAASGDVSGDYRGRRRTGAQRHHPPP